MLGDFLVLEFDHRTGNIKKKKKKKRTGNIESYGIYFSHHLFGHSFMYSFGLVIICPTPQALALFSCCC
jgi:hypothetical protein